MLAVVLIGALGQHGTIVFGRGCGRKGDRYHLFVLRNTPWNVAYGVGTPGLYQAESVQNNGLVQAHERRIDGLAARALQLATGIIPRHAVGALAEKLRAGGVTKGFQFVDYAF